MAALKALYSSKGSSNAYGDINNPYLAPTAKKPLSFRQLRDGELARLARILSNQLAPDMADMKSERNSYEKLTRMRSKRLPKRLRTRTRTWVSPQSSCKMHAPLNPHISMSIFRWIQKEIDVNIPAVMYALKQANCLPQSVDPKFHQLREVSAMWIGVEAYEGFFKSPVNPRWTLQADSCSSCILARMGGEAGVLTALKAGMIANTPSNEITISRRHRYIDLLIKNFDEEEAARIHREANVIGKDIVAATYILMRKWYKDRQQEAPTKELFHQGLNVPPAVSVVLDDSSSEINSSTSLETPEEPGQRIISQSYNFLDDVINEYRKTVYFPSSRRLNQKEPEEVDLDDYPFTLTRLSFDSSARSCGTNSYESSILSPTDTETWTSDMDREKYHAPIEQGAKERAESYRNDLNIDEFLRRLDEESPE